MTTHSPNFDEHLDLHVVPTFKVHFTSKNLEGNSVTIDQEDRECPECFELRSPDMWDGDCDICDECMNNKEDWHGEDIS